MLLIYLSNFAEDRWSTVLSFSGLNKVSKKNITGSLIALALLTLIVYKLGNEADVKQNIQELIDTFQSERWGLMVAIVCMAPLSWFVESLKWRFLVRKIQVLSLGTAFASVLTGMSFAMVTPGKTGDFAGRILYLQSKSRLRGTIASLVGSFAHMLATFTIATPSFIIVYLISKDWKMLCLGLAVLISGGGLGWLYFNLHRWTFTPKKNNVFNKLITALKVLKRYNRKDLKWVVFFSCIKFCIYTTQFVLVTWLFGNELGFFVSYATAAAMFWLIMVIPSFFLADVVVRGVVAKFLFIDTGISPSSTPIFAGTYIIWLVNWVIPSILGALTLLIIRLINSFSKEGD